MKTTIELPDNLFREAKAYAAKKGIPLRQVVEEGVRHVVHASAPAKKYKLKSFATKGEGLQVPGDWETIRSILYEGRGG